MGLSITPGCLEPLVTSLASQPLQRGTGSTDLHRIFLTPQPCRPELVPENPTEATGQQKRLLPG